MQDRDCGKVVGCEKIEEGKGKRGDRRKRLDFGKEGIQGRDCIERRLVIQGKQRIYEAVLWTRNCRNRNLCLGRA
jgi:hypothetical protein